MGTLETTHFPLPSLGTFMTEGPYEKFVRGFHWLSRGGISLMSVVQPRGDYPDPATSDVVVSMALRPSRAAWDVRAPSVKRVGGAIGEGAAVSLRSTSIWPQSKPTPRLLDQKRKHSAGFLDRLTVGCGPAGVAQPD